MEANSADKGAGRVGGRQTKERYVHERESREVGTVVNGIRKDQPDVRKWGRCKLRKRQSRDGSERRGRATCLWLGGLIYPIEWVCTKPESSGGTNEGAGCKNGKKWRRGRELSLRGNEMWRDEGRDGGRSGRQ